MWLIGVLTAAIACVTTWLVTPSIVRIAHRFGAVQQSIDVKQRDVDRKTTLVKSNSGSRLDLDNSISARVQAEGVNQVLEQQISNARNKLLGDLDLPLEKFPAYALA